MENKVFIKGITITNFKGLKNLTIIFKQITDLFGANGTGKTSVYDAFLWLLFGKNSEDKKDFNIKNTIDIALNRQDHEVEGIIVINGEENTLKRVYKEKWTKKRGEETAEYTGNETLYYWNDVPMQLKEFQSKINAILDENVFKLITNPLAFNSLKWQDRRGVLLQIAGSVTDAELAEGNPEYEALVANLTQGKTLEDFKKQIIASVTKAKADLKAIPTRIDEVSKLKPESHDFLKLAIDLEATEKDLENVESKITNESKAFDSVLEANKNKKIKASEIKGQIQIIESAALKQSEIDATPDTKVLDELKEKLSTDKSNLTTSENGVSTLKTKLSSLNLGLESLDKKIVSKREEWGIENAKVLTFNDDDFHCPTCKREFETGDVEGKKTEMLNDFKVKKQNLLSEISLQGQSLGKEKEATQKEIDDLNVRIEKGSGIVSDLKISIDSQEKAIEIEGNKTTAPKDANLIYECILSMNVEYKDKKEALAEVEATIQKVPEVDVSKLNQQKTELKTKIDDLKSKIQNETQIKVINNRIEDLENEEKTLAQQVANVEKTQFAIERFEKFKMESLEQKVSSKFKMVKFKMFETQVNGGETPACEILVNGVPFADANTASRINAGLDIINTLCEFYNITAPVFIDNRESCTEIIDSNSQIVSLIVSPEDKKLRVA